MPGMEVFTISGAALGDGGWYAGGSAQGAPHFAAAAATPAVQLQNALKALGNTRGDGTLSSIGVDGVIGPGTVKAVNYALKSIIGAGPVRQLGGRFLNATATKLDVQNNAAVLAQVVTQAVHAAGGSVPPPTVSIKRASARVVAEAQQALVADPSGTHSNLVWIVGGAALIVAALGFLAAKKRAAA